jgi:hypothetical protein
MIAKEPIKNRHMCGLSYYGLPCTCPRSSSSNGVQSLQALLYLPAGPGGLTKWAGEWSLHRTSARCPSYIDWTARKLVRIRVFPGKFAWDASKHNVTTSCLGELRCASQGLASACSLSGRRTPSRAPSPSTTRSACTTTLREALRLLPHPRRCLQRLAQGPTHGEAQVPIIHYLLLLDLTIRL